MLPRSVIVGLSNGVGHTASRLPLYNTKIAKKNLEAVFGNTKTPEEKRKILAISLSTFTLTMLDVLWFSSNPKKRISKYVIFEDGPLKEQFLSDQPLICITAHMGSWELLGQACALFGVDLASIGARIKNDTVDRLMVQMRERTGQTVIPRKGALRILISRLKKNGKAAFVLDQNTPEKHGGILIDLLGLPMPVSPAPAAMAYRTGTDIMLGYCTPDQKGKYRIHLSNVITPPKYDKALDSDKIARDLTQEIQNELSAEIRRRPQFWLWSYRHWRRKPNETYPPNYPSY